MSAGARRIEPRLVVGLILILLGAVFLLDELRLLDADDILEYWPVLVIAFGLSLLLRPGGARVVGVLLIVFGTLSLLEVLDVLYWDPWDMWPVALIVVGGLVIWRALTAGSGAAAPVAGRVPAPSPGSEVSVFALLRGVEVKNDSADFRGGDLTAILGGCEVDLRDASIGDVDAVIDTFAFMGGIDIRVPTDWDVVTRVAPILGGVEDATRTSEAGAKKRLLIRGTTLFGGVEVSN